MDNVGKINADTTRNYYLKDHLGSIRVVLNSTNGVISAQDYDAWGYPLENRTYQFDNIKYSFIASELDHESNYTHFGVRKYDSRIGRFLAEEPYINSSFGWGSYVYSANNPLIIIDPYGTDWFFNREDNDWEWHDVKERYMWTGEYDEKGHKTYEKVLGHEELLYFQGSQLEFLKKGGDREKWEAVSGKGDKTQPEKQNISNEGPIPEGKWYVDLKNAYSIDDANNIVDYIKWVAKSYSLGTAFINLSPADVNTNRTEGFAIHGGWFKGSAGCIDLTAHMNQFYKSYMDYNRNMLLIVNYSNFKK